jgi:TetR/AcrR family transcriptional regulator
VIARPAYKNIAMLMEKDDSAFISGLRSLSQADRARVSGLFERDKMRGLIKQDVDCGLVMDIVHAFTLHEFFRAGSNDELFLSRIDGMIKVVSEGIAASPAQAEHATKEEKSI